MTEDAKVLELANTLKKQGLAVSMVDAIDRARAILGIQLPKKEEKIELDKPDFDISQQSLTLNDLMRQAGVAEPEKIREKYDEAQKQGVSSYEPLEEPALVTEVKEAEWIEANESAGAIFEEKEEEQTDGNEASEIIENKTHEPEAEENSESQTEQFAWDEEKPEEEQEAKELIKEESLDNSETEKQYD